MLILVDNNLFCLYHKVLAINRGESRKMLSVRVEIPNYVSDRFLDFCKGTFLPKAYDQTRFKVIVCSAEDAYKRLIEPLMARTVRLACFH